MIEWTEADDKIRNAMRFGRSCAKCGRELIPNEPGSAASGFPTIPRRRSVSPVSTNEEIRAGSAQGRRSRRRLANTAAGRPMTINITTRSSGERSAAKLAGTELPRPLPVTNERRRVVRVNVRPVTRRSSQRELTRGSARRLAVRKPIVGVMPLRLITVHHDERLIAVTR
jgi:hypothetical protein